MEDLPEVANPGADKAIVGKVPVSNDVKLCQFPEIFVLEIDYR